MNVQGSAFYFGLQAEAQEAQFDPFFNSLTALPPKTEWPLHRPFIEGYAYRRRLFCNAVKDGWCGVVLSARATEFHHYVQQVGNQVTVVARENGPNAPVEVNFFCIRKDSFKGIYSSYYGSYSFHSFLADLWGTYRQFVAEAREAHVRTLIGQGVEEEDIEDARKLYSMRGRAAYSPLYNPGSFEELVRQLNIISEVRLTTYAVDAKSDQPVSDRIHNVHKVYRLQDGQRLDRTLFDWIINKKRAATRLLKTGKSSFSGSVLGTDADGDTLTIPFTSALDDHLKFNYDDIGSFDVADLASNPCLAEMLSKLRTAILFRP